MSKTITLDDIKILEWTVNVGSRSVIVSYQVLDDEGDHYKSDSAVFWDTIPDEVVGPEGLMPNPDNWYQLPAKYTSFLTDLTVDAKNALLHLVN